VVRDQPAVVAPGPRRGIALLVVGAGLLAVVLIGGVAALRSIAARSDRQVRDQLAALERDGLAARPDVADAAEVDAAPLLRAALDALAVSDAERDSLARELAWRRDPEHEWDPRAAAAPIDSSDDDPESPRWTRLEQDAARQHDVDLAHVLAGLDAVTPAIDRGLEADVWRAPDRDLRDELLFRGSTRGGAAYWRDLARVARITVMIGEPTVAGALAAARDTETLAEHVERILPLGPIDDDSAVSIEASLTKLERPDALSLGLRADLAPTLAAWTPDADGFERYTGQRSFTHPVSFVTYLTDRPRWVRFQCEAVRAALLPVDRARLRLDELVAEVIAAGDQAPITRCIMVAPRCVDRLAGGCARARMARMALSLARAASTGDLPPTADGALEDPFATPPAMLRWRRAGPREGVLWSVGPNQRDDCGKSDPDPDGQPLDLVLRVTLPER
jgi:hypothetical protein